MYSKLLYIILFVVLFIKNQTMYLRDITIIYRSVIVLDYIPVFVLNTM